MKEQRRRVKEVLAAIETELIYNYQLMVDVRLQHIIELIIAINGGRRRMYWHQQEIGYCYDSLDDSASDSHVT